ncbi:hypothetical protein Vretifemale_12584 [Volvox reticuliferus]|uniref:5'-3' exonuclease domain-containing protein n=2 Tax=Volvox reticuliferus TaxID=1737510 RepID=A0A8J4CIR0_9CHLO|nr:hypothetical protein Vretifemale_12584 [Volvox reticuliferus]
MYFTAWISAIGGMLSSSMGPVQFCLAPISCRSSLTTLTSRFVPSIKPDAPGTLRGLQARPSNSTIEPNFCYQQQKDCLGGRSCGALPSTATSSAICPPRFRSGKDTSSQTSRAPAKPRPRFRNSIFEPAEQLQQTETLATTSDFTVASPPKPRTRRSKNFGAEQVAPKPFPAQSPSDSGDGAITQQLDATVVRRATATQPSQAAEATVRQTTAAAGILLIVDGNYLANRSFFGYGRVRGLSTSTGTPTSVTYGVMRVLQAALRRVQPTSLAVVFDPPGPTFRSALSLIEPVAAAAGGRGIAAAELVQQGRLDWKDLASRLLSLPPVVADMQAAAAAEVAAAPASYLHPSGSFLPPPPPPPPLLTTHVATAAASGDLLHMQPPALRCLTSTAGLAAMLAAALGPELAEVLSLTEPAGPAAVATFEPSYKAGRASKGGEFYSDLMNLQRLLGLMSVTPLSRPWLEADDLAGLLVQQAVQKGMAVRILSGDRDLMQLVSDPWDVAMLYPTASLPERTSSSSPSGSPPSADTASLSTANAEAASARRAGTSPPPPRSRLQRAGTAGRAGGGTATDFPFVELREADVVSALGVAPALVPDYKALTGDASDRLPGVAGIGPKTAVELLALYGNLAGVHCAAAVRTSKLSSKRRAALQDALPASQYTVTMARVLGSPGGS